jgi:hypothetical protein
MFNGHTDIVQPWMLRKASQKEVEQSYPGLQFRFHNHDKMVHSPIYLMRTKKKDK